MKEAKTNNLELFHDVVEESNNLLYEATHKPYFELIDMTCKNILENEIISDVDLETENKLKEIYSRLNDVDFSVEDVRKAMQAIFLRGFKEMKMPNSNTTPDTLGIFMTYLLSKMINKKEISIVDPMCGVGNLLFTISNHIDKETNLYACDNNYWMTDLTRITADLLNKPVEIFFQDCESLFLSGMDAVVFDMPNCVKEKDNFFPYDAMLHFADYLADGGAMIGILQNDFFDYDKNQEFKKALFEKVSLVGMCELPDNMFAKGKAKIILVLQKKEIKDHCFMVKLPSFSNVSDFNESLLNIEAWFEKNK